MSAHLDSTEERLALVEEAPVIVALALARGWCSRVQSRPLSERAARAWKQHWRRERAKPADVSEKHPSPPCQ